MKSYRTIFHKICAVHLVCAAVVLSLPIYSTAQPAKNNNVNKVTSSVLKEVEGTVTWIGKSRIAVSYGIDAQGVENEMLLPFDKDIKVAHKQKVSDIQRGDIVQVLYEEVVEDGPEGKREYRRAKQISFKKPGKEGDLPLPPDELRKQEANSTSGVLGSY